MPNTLLCKQLQLYIPARAVGDSEAAAASQGSVKSCQLLLLLWQQASVSSEAAWQEVCFAVAGGAAAAAVAPAAAQVHLKAAETGVNYKISLSAAPKLFLQLVTADHSDSVGRYLQLAQSLKQAGHLQLVA